jgi:D-alanyl-D-alanine carboxypeptidase
MGLFAALVAVVALTGPGSAAGEDPVFRGTISTISPSLRQWMIGRSWHRGCPVRIRDLRVLRLDFWGFDGTVRRGRMVVHANQAYRVRRVFHRLFDARFHIRRMHLVDRYDGSDHLSMARDNTSAFNCRRVGGPSSPWSQHAYGRAIDVNPVENPYVAGSYVSPPAGASYVDRSRHAKGMIHAGGVVVRSFASQDWKWGGYWTYPKDYQHFSRNGH